jgi:hypothetical protein
VPFQLTVDAAMKSLPLTLRVNAGLPATSLAGVSEAIDGTGFDAAVSSVLVGEPQAHSASARPKAAGRKPLKMGATDMFDEYR